MREDKEGAGGGWGTTMPVCSPGKKGGRAVWAELPELLYGLIHHRVSHWPGAARGGCSMWSVTLALCHGRSASTFSWGTVPAPGCSSPDFFYEQMK